METLTETITGFRDDETSLSYLVSKNKVIENNYKKDEGNTELETQTLNILSFRFKRVSISTLEVLRCILHCPLDLEPN